MRPLIIFRGNICWRQPNKRDTLFFKPIDDTKDMLITEELLDTWSLVDSETAEVDRIDASCTGDSQIHSKLILTLEREENAKI
jgi:hypothetical protein